MDQNQHCAELTTNKNEVEQVDRTDNEHNLTDEQAVVNNHKIYIMNYRLQETNHYHRTFQPN